jgi:hypothetical protein
MSLQTPIPAGSERSSTLSHAPTHELVDFDRYVVSHNGPVGYIEVVSHLFVCYLGHPFARAEEVAQVLDFDSAVRIVSERAATSQRHKLAP